MAKPEKEKGFIDPGEGALAGLAMGASLLAKAGPRIGNEVLRYITPRETPWVSNSPGEFKTIKRTVYEMASNPGYEVAPKGKSFMDLFKIRGRFKAGDPAALVDSVIEMDKMQPSVDSFIRKYDLSKKGVTVRFSSSPLIAPGYDPVTKRVKLKGVGEASALHELGHAADFTGSKMGRFRGKMRIPLQNAVAAILPIALIAGDEIKKALPGTVDDRAIEFVQNNAPAILGATLAVTQLYPEGKASFLALKHVQGRSGSRATKRIAKTLLPMWGNYLLATVAPMIGLAFAKKYYFDAKKKNELLKEAGVVSFAKGFGGGVYEVLKEIGMDLGHVSREIGHGTSRMLSEPGRISRISKAAKSAGTSPKFIEGALMAGIPAALVTAYMYGPRHGVHVGKKLDKVSPTLKDDYLSTGRVNNRIKKQIPEEWKFENPGLYAGLVGIGAAVSGGIITRMFSDILRVM